MKRYTKLINFSQAQQEEKREDSNKIRNERWEIITDTTEIGKKPLENTMNN